MNLPALLAALAIIESSDAKHPAGNDLARGKRGEVSRYQIMPATWKRFGGGALVNAHDPSKSKVIALRIVRSFRWDFFTDGDSVRLAAIQWNPTWLGRRSHRQKLTYCWTHPNCYPNRVLREYQAIVRR